MESKEHLSLELTQFFQECGLDKEEEKIFTKKQSPWKKDEPKIKI
jgi:hypothetical protein